MGIDPVVQGLWRVHTISYDEARTVKPMGGIAFARVGAYEVEILLGKRKRVAVERVYIVDDANGNPANLVEFSGGMVWIITKKPGQRYVAVQAGRACPDTKEEVRFVVTVH
jgi:hypothetical protein